MTRVASHEPRSAARAARRQQVAEACVAWLLQGGRGAGGRQSKQGALQARVHGRRSTGTAGAAGIEAGREVSGPRGGSRAGRRGLVGTRRAYMHCVRACVRACDAQTSAPLPASRAVSRSRRVVCVWHFSIRCKPAKRASWPERAARDKPSQRSLPVVSAAAAAASAVVSSRPPCLLEARQGRCMTTV